jgi:hypothetical protein
MVVVVVAVGRVAMRRVVMARMIVVAIAVSVSAGAVPVLVHGLRIRRLVFAGQRVKPARRVVRRPAWPRFPPFTPLAEAGRINNNPLRYNSQRS